MQLINYSKWRPLFFPGTITMTVIRLPFDINLIGIAHVQYIYNVEHTFLKIRYVLND